MYAFRVRFYGPYGGKERWIVVYVERDSMIDALAEFRRHHPNAERVRLSRVRSV